MSDIRPPQDWQDAFAALPLETPPAEARARFAAQLASVRPRRPRWQLPAIAAAVCALAAAPALLLVDRSTPDREPGVLTTDVAQTPATSIAAQAEIVEATPAPAAAVIEQVDTAPATVTAAVQRRPNVATAATQPPAELQRLHAESARLEALLAELSDGDGGDVVQLSVAAALQAQVVGIDDALATAPLESDMRTSLWRERVEALRQLTSVAADQRLAALYGGGADYAVLPVY